MDTDELSQKIKGFFNKAVDASKEAFTKAGNKVQDFSDKSVIRIEKHKLETSLNETFLELGKSTFPLIKAADNSVKFSSPDEESASRIKELQNKILDLQKQIAEKEELLKKTEDAE